MVGIRLCRDVVIQAFSFIHSFSLKCLLSTCYEPGKKVAADSRCSDAEAEAEAGELEWGTI